MTPAQGIAALVELGLPTGLVRRALQIIEAVAEEASRPERERLERDRIRKSRMSVGSTTELPGRSKNTVDVPSHSAPIPEIPGNSRNADDIYNTTNPKQNNNNSVTSSAPLTKTQRRDTRGTRLPPDWEAKPAALQDALNLGLTVEEYEFYLDEFKTFWPGEPGSRGVKLNWDGTWRNRYRAMAKQKRERNGRSPTYSKPPSISERYAGFAAKLDAQDDGESGHSGSGENVARLPGLRKSA